MDGNYRTKLTLAAHHDSFQALERTGSDSYACTLRKVGVRFGCPQSHGSLDCANFLVEETCRLGACADHAHHTRHSEDSQACGKRDMNKKIAGKKRQFDQG